MKQELKQVGMRLRVARQGQGLTLEELAADAGMSASTLSRLESGKRQANLELLLPLTRRLGISLDDLVFVERRDPRVRRAVVEKDGIIIAPLSPEGAPISTFRITYPPTVEVPALRVHEGFEWFYVLSGRIRLWLGDQHLVLEPGEAVEFDTRTPHAMRAADRQSAEIISIFNEAGIKMHTHNTGWEGAERKDAEKTAE